MDGPGMRGFDALDRRFAALASGKATKLLLGQLGDKAVTHAWLLAPRKTGNLKRTIRVDDVDTVNQTVRVVAGGMDIVGYAADVEFGTRPHIIRPVHGKPLAWGGTRRLSGSLRKGAKPDHFAWMVRHPGTKAKPYLVPGAKAALHEVGLDTTVVRVWNEAA